MFTAVSAGWGLLVVAILVAVVVSMTKNGTLSLEGGIGLRTPATQHCDECWIAGHRAALPVMRWVAPVAVVVAVAAVLLVVLLPLRGDAPEVVAGVAGVVDGVGYVLVVGLALWAALRPDRAALWVHS
ncbi:hypothetical protein OG218_13625 [Kineococcus sp. NBC_00420]|uniref:hypothetical protein n=1 Tax=Kineococcus sp. NBC_00420 TaxID=2903564 RepID=UPI002E2406D6